MSSDNIFYYLVGAVVVVLIGYPITTWYHQLEKRNRYLETQIRLLTHIALNQPGVDKDRIADILLDSKIPTFSISNSSTEEKLQLLGIRRDLGELSEEDYSVKKKELLGTYQQV